MKQAAGVGDDEAIENDASFRGLVTNRVELNAPFFVGMYMVALPPTAHRALLYDKVTGHAHPVEMGDKAQVVELYHTTDPRGLATVLPVVKLNGGGLVKGR